MTRTDAPSVTASDGRRNETERRADAESARGDETDDEPKEGRFDKYVEYLLDLLSFL